jgi:hypothetical protein
MDLRSLSEDAPESQWRDPLRDKVGAEQLQQVHHCTTQTDRSDGGPERGIQQKIGCQGEQLLWVIEPASGVWRLVIQLDRDLQGCQAACPLAQSMSRAARKRNKCLERFAWCPLALFHDLSAPVGVPVGA